MLQLTVQNGAKLPPNVPKGTGGTKFKSKTICMVNKDEY